jgi:hypothetical protein
LKALVVRQPWANLIACGMKTIEIRSWATAHRGKLVICSAKAVDSDAGEEYSCEPRGVTICVVTLVNMRKLRHSDARRAMFRPCGWMLYEGSYAWVLSEPRPLAPHATKGRLKLFDVPDTLITLTPTRVRRLVPN